MTDRLADKVCIITGSGGSMGRASALKFAREGAFIVGCDIDAVSAQETLDQVTAAGGQMVSCHPCNLTEVDDCERLVNLAVDTFGGIDVLFNNGAKAYFGWITEKNSDFFQHTIVEELNLVYFLCRAAWPHLLKRGKASIINTSSAAAHMPTVGLPGIAHSAAKAGVCGMTRHLAMEGGPYQIRANSISPGPVLTTQSKQHIEDPAFWSEAGRKIMLGRPGVPEDIANCAVFLASDESSWATGADFRIDGGMTAW
jgi:NAD(P)-dependent dehydrogenase (short-subunit alcohol dehydrogenase family)